MLSLTVNIVSCFCGGFLHSFLRICVPFCLLDYSLSVFLSSKHGWGEGHENSSSFIWQLKQPHTCFSWRQTSYFDTQLKYFMTKVPIFVKQHIKKMYANIPIFKIQHFTALSRTFLNKLPLISFFFLFF